MSPDDIRVVLRSAFPALVAKERHNPDGWSFFYEEPHTGTRIITATRSSATARTRLLRAVSDREGRVCGYQPFEGGREELCRIVAQEIDLYRSGRC
jgi:hypothetical protein